MYSRDMGRGNSRGGVNVRRGRRERGERAEEVRRRLRGALLRRKILRGALLRRKILRRRARRARGRGRSARAAPGREPREAARRRRVGRCVFGRRSRLSHWRRRRGAWFELYFGHAAAVAGVRRRAELRRGDLPRRRR